MLAKLTIQKQWVDIAKNGKENVPSMLAMKYKEVHSMHGWLSMGLSFSS